MLELSSLAAIGRHARPVIGPSLVLVRAQGDHRLDREAHARFRLADGLVLGVVRNVGSAVEELVNAVAAVGLDDAAVGCFGNLLDGVAVVAEERTGLDELDRFFKTVASGLDDTNAVRVLGCLANVVCLVQVAVETAVVECDVNVEDIAVLKRALVGNAVADNFVDRCANRLREMAVVQR